MLPAFTGTLMLALPKAVRLLESNTLVGSELVMVNCTPPAGAADPKEADRLACKSLPTLRSPILIAGWGLTEMVDVASLIPGEPALNVVTPTATPVTTICADVSPVPTVTVEGTVAIDASSVLRLNVNPPAGAGAEICSVMLLVADSITPRLGVEKFASRVTFAALTSGAKPEAVPVMPEPANLAV